MRGDPPLECERETIKGEPLGIYFGRRHEEGEDGGQAYDPLTRRMLSVACWNTRHQPEGGPDALRRCIRSGCRCLCHDPS